MSRLRFHAGWQKRWRDGLFALSCLKYLRKGKYPLFSIAGALRLRAVGTALKLGKLVEFNGTYFTSPSLPHRPSRAFDHMVAGGGLNFEAAGTPLKRQVSVVLMAITRKCGLHCAHCYERFNLGAEDVVPVERWKEVTLDVQRVGAGVIVFSGGEPMLRYEGLLELLNAGDAHLSDFHIHTSGRGVTNERARELRAAGLTAAAVGLDDVDPARHDALRGWAGSHQQAVEALRVFYDAGIFTYTNVCLTPGLIRSGGLWTYYELAKQLNVGMIELLEPRPCGGLASGAPRVMLSEEDRALATQFFIQGNTDARYRDYPLISYVAYKEAPARFGCTMGGLMQLYIDSKGNVNPCVFLPVTFGNVMTEDYEGIFDRMRAAMPRPFHGECPSIVLSPALWRTATQDARRASWPVPYTGVRREWNDLIRP